MHDGGEAFCCRRLPATNTEFAFQISSPMCVQLHNKNSKNNKRVKTKPSKSSSMHPKVKRWGGREKRIQIGDQSWMGRRVMSEHQNAQNRTE